MGGESPTFALPFHNKQVRLRAEWCRMVSMGSRPSNPKSTNNLSKTRSLKCFKNVDESPKIQRFLCFHIVQKEASLSSAIDWRHHVNLKGIPTWCATDQSTNSIIDMWCDSVEDDGHLILTLWSIRGIHCFLGELFQDAQACCG